MREILTTGRYFRQKFGHNVYKVPVSLKGFTCPNIDGSIAKGGCTFCENESFSPNLTEKTSKKFYLNPNSKDNPILDYQIEQINTQYYNTKRKLAKKFGAKKFLVYFQSFTNTYAPLSTLKALYEYALSLDDVIGLSIGTRADCVDDEILEYLSKLSQDKEIWIEYGIQSIYDDILENINRAETTENTEKWIIKSKEYGLNVCGHLIFGLPHESQDMMLDSIKFINDLKVDSIKIHPMYVTKNTALAGDFYKDKFIPITQELYNETVVKALKRLNENVIIQRITAGIDNDSLLAPEWCKNKHNQINSLKKALKEENLLY